MKMATRLKLDDRLDEAGNFVPWKARLVLILEENELWDEVVQNTIANPIIVPASTDAQALSAFNKDIKARRIILDAVKDHVIPHISSKTRAYQMRDCLSNLFQISNGNKKMVLREKLKSIKMAKEEGLTSYLTRISKVRNELAMVGEVSSGTELVQITVNGVAKPWVVFAEAIVARENLPSWDRLWDDFV